MMPIHKLLLNGSVESLQAAIRFWMSWIIEEMSQFIVPAAGIEMFGEFTAIIGLDSRGYEWGHGHELLEKITTVG